LYLGFHVISMYLYLGFHVRLFGNNQD
jgi:hypothetical protein